MRGVPSAVDVPGRGEDAEVVVPIGVVPPDRVPGVLDVDPVRAVPVRRVAGEEVPGRALEGVDPVAGARPNGVLPEHAAGDREQLDPDLVPEGRVVRDPEAGPVEWPD